MHLLYLSTLALLLSSTVKSDKWKRNNILLCYYAEWSVWREADGKFNANYIDPHLCDIIVYSYTGLNASTNEIVSKSPYTDYELYGNGQIAKIVAMKAKNPDLKVMVCCGGWNEGSLKFSSMAASETKRGTFIRSVVQYLKLNKLDGLDLAWEFPADRGGIPEDKENFATLLEELRQEFDKYGFLLTAQLGGKKYVIDPGYDVPRISNAVHYINLVAYQYNYPGGKITEHNEPLNSLDEFNVEFSVNYMIRKGVTPEKILLGFSTYGHQFVMDQPVEDGNYIRVPASKTYPAVWSDESGFVGFNEVCYNLTTGSWRDYWDEMASVPFTVNGDKFISYQNRRSYLKKLNFLKDKGLGGAMVWSIDTDDFKGLCYQMTYPLIREIREYLKALNDRSGFEEDIAGHDYNSTLITEFYRIAL